MNIISCDELFNAIEFEAKVNLRSRIDAFES